MAAAGAAGTDHQDAFWVERARRGDAAAFGLLMRKHAPLVRRVLISRLGKTDDLDDLAQETWLHVYTGLPRLRETGRFAAWLQGIALNVARLWLREQRGQARLSEALTREEARVPLSPAAFCSPVEAMVAAREERNALYAAMESLPPAARDAARLRYRHGLSYPEIAARLGVPVQTVKSRLHKARRQLLARLGPVFDAATPPAAAQPRNRHKESEKMANDKMIPAEIYEVYNVQVAYDKTPVVHTVVFLKARDAERYLPIFIGAGEALHIASHLRGATFERPFTYELFARLIDELGAQITRIQISALRDTTYYATLHAGNKDGAPLTQIDCRPSDALALALRTGATIEIASEVLEQAGQDSGTFTDSIPTGEKLLSLQPMEIGIPLQEFLSRTSAAASE